MIKLKFKEFLNSYIYLNNKKKNLNIMLYKNNKKFKFILIYEINEICKKLSILYLIIYFIILYNKNIIIINFNNKINKIINEIIHLTNIYTLNNKIIKNYYNIKSELFLFYWLNFIYLNIKNYNNYIKKYFYKNYIKIYKKKNIFRIFYSKNYFILIDNIKNINFIENKYIININSNKFINNNLKCYLNININNNYLTYTYILKLITISILKSKFNKNKILNFF